MPDKIAIIKVARAHSASAVDWKKTNQDTVDGAAFSKHGDRQDLIARPNVRQGTPKQLNFNTPPAVVLTPYDSEVLRKHHEQRLASSVPASAIDFEGKAKNNRSAQFGFGENEPSGVENEDPDAVANGDGRGRSNLDEGENGPNLEVGDPSRAPTPGEAAFESSWQNFCQQYRIINAAVNPQGGESASAGTEGRRNRTILFQLRDNFCLVCSEISLD
jgi:hypothetical protein